MKEDTRAVWRLTAPRMRAVWSCIFQTIRDGIYEAFHLESILNRDVVDFKSSKKGAASAKILIKLRDRTAASLCLGKGLRPLVTDGKSGREVGS